MSRSSCAPTTACPFSAAVSAASTPRRTIPRSEDNPRRPRATVSPMIVARRDALPPLLSVVSRSPPGARYAPQLRTQGRCDRACRGWPSRRSCTALARTWRISHSPSGLSGSIPSNATAAPTRSSPFSTRSHGSPAAPRYITTARARHGVGCDDDPAHSASEWSLTCCWSSIATSSTSLDSRRLAQLPDNTYIHAHIHTHAHAAREFTLPLSLFRVAHTAGRTPRPRRRQAVGRRAGFTTAISDTEGLHVLLPVVVVVWMSPPSMVTGARRSLSYVPRRPSFPSDSPSSARNPLAQERPELRPPPRVKQIARALPRIAHPTDPKRFSRVRNALRVFGNAIFSINDCLFF